MMSKYLLGIRWLLLFIFIGREKPGYAQQYLVKQLKVADGLPSNVINTLAFSSTHQLWLGTQRGLFIYDGYQFTPVEGVTRSIESLALTTDNIYFYEIGKGLKSIKLPSNGNIKTLAAPIFEDDNPNNDHFDHVYIDEKNRIWCSDFNYIKFLEGQDTSFIHLPINNGKNQTLLPPFNVLYQKENALIFSAIGNWHYHFEQKTLLPTEWKPIKTIAPFQNAYAAIDTSGTLVKLNLKQNTLSPISKHPDWRKAIKLYEHQQKLFLLTSHHLYTIDSTLKQWETIYTDSSSHLTDFCIDSTTGIFWLASDNGLIQLTPQSTLFKPYYLPHAKDEYVLHIQHIDSTTYLLSNRHQLYSFKGRNIAHILSVPNPHGYVSSMSAIDNRLYIALGNTIFELVQKLQKLPIKNMPPNTLIKKLIKTSFNEYWLLQENQPVIRINASTLEVINTPFLNDSDFWTKNKWNDIKEHQGQIWLIGWMPQSHGITYYQPEKQAFQDLAQEKKHEKGIFVGDYYHQISEAQNGDLLLSAYGGWNRMQSNGKVIQRVDILNYPIFSDIVKGISHTPNGDILFGTSEGLYIYRPSIDIVNAFTEQEGLPANNIIYAFHKINDSILAVGMKNGFFEVNLNKLLHTKLLNRLLFTAVNIDGIAQNSEKTLHYTPNNNVLEIKFSALTFHQQNQIRYRYRYTMDSVWIDLGTLPEIKLTHLPYGKYDIEIQAGDNLNNWQSKGLKLYIYAPPPFLKSTLFYSLLALCLVTIAFFIARFFILKARKEALMQEKILKSEMSALRAQMNPHFLFNSLNAINSFIIQEKSEQAGEYLTAFSKLLRYILEYTKEDTITLKEEIKALRIYLQLESARLENSFDYHILVDKEIDAESLSLPPLIIQPFVENAIWHGIRNIAHRGEIIVNIELIEKGIKITVSDNGIGRKKSMERVQSQFKRKRLGMSISEDRIKLINSKNRIVITDLDLETNRGTVVTIYLYNSL